MYVTQRLVCGCVVWALTLFLLNIMVRRTPTCSIYRFPASVLENKIQSLGLYHFSMLMIFDMYYLGRFLLLIVIRWSVIV